MPAKITTDLRQATEQTVRFRQEVVRLNRASARSAVTPIGDADPSERPVALEQEFRALGLLA